jgi:hypothetical protein
MHLAASGLYGVLLVSVMAGILVYVNILTPHSYLGSYTIEQYSINGVPVALKPGDIGTAAKAYLEYNHDFVLSLDEKSRRAGLRSIHAKVYSLGHQTSLIQNLF